MDNKGRVTVVLQWDHRSQTYRGSSNSGNMDTSPSKKTMSHQQNGVGGLLMENNNNNIGPLKREPNQVFQQQQQPVPNVYRHGSTPQITVIHHDAIPPSMHDGSSKYDIIILYIIEFMIISLKSLKRNIIIILGQYYNNILSLPTHYYYNVPIIYTYIRLNGVYDSAKLYSVSF